MHIWIVRSALDLDELALRRPVAIVTGFEHLVVRGVDRRRLARFHGIFQVRVMELNLSSNRLVALLLISSNNL